MRLSVDSVIEPIPEAIRRTAEDEIEDLDNACDNAVNEAYLNWPNEAGVSLETYTRGDRPHMVASMGSMHFDRRSRMRGGTRLLTCH